MTERPSEFEYRIIEHKGSVAEIINPYLRCSYECRYCYCRAIRKNIREALGVGPLTKISNHSDLVIQLLRMNHVSQYAFLGTAVDPYPLWEADLRITEALLTECSKSSRNIIIATKSTLILRDLDILSKCRNSLVFISLASMSKTWSERFEPLSPSPEDRLNIIKELSRREIDVGLFLAPIIPGNNDKFDNLCHLVEVATSVGARFCIIGLALSSTLKIPKKLDERWR